MTATGQHADGWRDADGQLGADVARADALQRMCTEPGCGAAPGDRCRNVVTGHPLMFPAHTRRLHPDMPAPRSKRAPEPPADQADDKQELTP